MRWKWILVGYPSNYIHLIIHLHPPIFKLDIHLMVVGYPLYKFIFHAFLHDISCFNDNHGIILVPSPLLRASIQIAMPRCHHCQPHLLTMSTHTQTHTHIVTHERTQQRHIITPKRSCTIFGWLIAKLPASSRKNGRYWYGALTWVKWRCSRQHHIG